MKKLFTLLFCTAILSSAFAQEVRHEWNDHDGYYEHHDRDYDHDHDRQRHVPGLNYIIYQNNQYGFNQRDELIEHVSHRYDYQVQQVINDWSLSRREKRFAIKNLRYDEAQQIANINDQCANGVSIYGGRPGRYHRDND